MKAPSLDNAAARRHRSAMRWSLQWGGFRPATSRTWQQRRGSCGSQAPARLARGRPSTMAAARHYGDVNQKLGCMCINNWETNKLFISSLGKVAGLRHLSLANQQGSGRQQSSRAMQQLKIFNSMATTALHSDGSSHHDSGKAAMIITRSMWVSWSRWASLVFNNGEAVRGLELQRGWRGAGLRHDGEATLACSSSGKAPPFLLSP